MDVKAWLEGLGLGEYADAFAKDHVDEEVLPTINDADLEKLGVLSLGHRKRLLAAIRALPAGSDARVTPCPAASGGSDLRALLDVLPAILALPLREYLDEANPVLKLWHACDVVELTLRLAVGLGVGDLARGGELPPDLLAELQPRIEEPTLGKWRGMAQAVVKHLPAEGTLVPELRSLVEGVLVPLLDGAAKPRTPHSSLSALRNQLAHGGGVTRAAAERLLGEWRGRLDAAFAELRWLGDLAFVVRSKEGSLGVLRGPRRTLEPWSPPDEATTAAVTEAFSRGEEVVAVRSGRALRFWPLAAYGPPRSPDPDAPPAREETAQVFARRGDVRLHYTPVGSDEVCIAEGDDPALAEFLRLFLAPSEKARRAEKAFEVRGFEADIRKDAGRLVGRTGELERVREALAAVSQGALWLSGPAGIGKSYLVARIAAELLDDPPANTLVLPFRFKAGDDRCSRDAFLRFALERLASWEALQRDAAAGGEEEKAGKRPLERLRDLLGSLGDNRVLFILDGLDEIGERDERFAQEVPLSLDLPGVVWLCGGRPERGLPEAFEAAGAIALFPDGLPPMGPGDIRTMLLEKIGPLLKRLVGRDRDEGDRVVNPFIEKVADYAQGLPLYVTYVIGDILNNRFRALDVGERLPESLSKYHEELLKRCAVGVLHQVLTPLAATIAVAREPLTAEALADLLVRRNLVDSTRDEPVALVKRGLAAIASMLRRSATPDGAEGFTLYHHSLQQHMEQSPEMAGPLGTARAALAEFALAPGKADAPAAAYLYGHGVAHLVETGKPAEALGLLCRFDYLMDRLQALQDAGAVPALAEDWRAVLKADVPLDRDARLWESFFREREHVLRRGNDRWPAYRILLQLAVEHADDSPVTQQAEDWLEQGQCHWLWLRNPRRVAHVAPDPCLRVFEGHKGSVWGALLLPDCRILSWSEDNTLRLWSAHGEALATLTGHNARIRGAQYLPDHRILSWSEDNTLRLWSAHGEALTTLTGHTGSVMGAEHLSDGRILSWSEDKTLCLWSAEGEPPTSLEGHAGSVRGASHLLDGRILSWSKDNTLRLWSAHGEALATLTGHSKAVNGAQVLPDEIILSWSSDGTLRLWSDKGEALAILAGHNGRIRGAQHLPDGRILSWSEDHTLRLWSAHGEPLATLRGHTGSVTGAQRLPDDRILSWSTDNTVRLWSADGQALATIAEQDADQIIGAQHLPDGRILSWSTGHTLVLWSAVGQALSTLVGHTGWVEGAQVLSDGRILSWSSDGTLRLWSSDDQTLGTLHGHAGWVEGAQVLPNERILSWSSDGTLCLWSAEGEALASLVGHMRGVQGARSLPDGRILFWSVNEDTLGLWSPEGAPLTALEGHTGGVQGAQPLPDGRILSWSQDGALRLWSPEGQAVSNLHGHTGWVEGAQVLPDARILSWSSDGTLRFWSAEGEALASLVGHTRGVWGAQPLLDGRILSWSWDNTLRTWSPEGAPLATLEGHTGLVIGAQQLPDGRVLSWSKDNTMRLWSAEGEALAIFQGHTRAVRGAQLLPAGRILSWSDDETLRFWSADGEVLEAWDADNAPDWVIALGAETNLLQEGLLLRAHRLRVAVADAVWHANASVLPEAFLPDGTVVTLSSGHVFCLKLHHGNRSVTAAEAAQLVGGTS